MRNREEVATVPNVPTSMVRWFDGSMVRSRLSARSLVPEGFDGVDEAGDGGHGRSVHVLGVGAGGVGKDLMFLAKTGDLHAGRDALEAGVNLGLKPGEVKWNRLGRGWA